MDKDSMPTCTVTVDDVYGDGWWEKNKDRVLRLWKVALAPVKLHDRCITNSCDVRQVRYNDETLVSLIILGPARQTLMEMYGVDRVEIPEGHEWTGEASNHCEADLRILVKSGSMFFAWHSDNGFGASKHVRYLILRRTEPRVWFKAEEQSRLPLKGDWYSGYTFWSQAAFDFSSGHYICATRHEELTPAYTLTQAMVDEGRVR